MLDVPCASVTSFSYHTSEARCLKIDKVLVDDNAWFGVRIVIFGISIYNYLHTILIEQL